MIDENKLRADIMTLELKLASIATHIEELSRQIASTYATKAYVQTYTEHLLGDIIPLENQYTENYSIVGYIPLDIERVLKHFQNIGGTYTLHDYRKILMDYDIAAKIGNIDPYIAVAQMAKETDFGRSFWSQRPRRNPAGIGVTGEESTKEQDKSLWAFDTTENIWKKGYSFPSWEIATQAHIGHLLAYAYKHDALTSDQIALVAVDPRAKFIPATTRGTVKKLKDLDGKWAIPGIGYGKAIATLANALKK
jgi:mannosyl-glycoprotein endo-beta-N-acetylglucosaminidase